MRMITYKIVDRTYFSQYDLIPMLVHVSSCYKIEKINRGLGGFTLVETPIEPYTKDMSVYEIVSEYEQQFDISNWAVFMAFDGKKAVGGATIVSRTKEVNMLSGRNDLAILWDIRVDDAYKRQGVGQTLFDMAVEWSRNQGLVQMKIECQNINIPACEFYHKQGAVLSAIDEYAYYNEPECRHEVQLIWVLDL
jgi:GNAT superfamily N-acetyltransferase